MLIIMGGNQKEHEWRAFTDVQGRTNIAIAGRKGAKTCRDALMQEVKERCLDMVRCARMCAVQRAVPAPSG